MGRNRLFPHLRLEISNLNAVFLSRGLPGRTSEFFFPHLVLRFLRSGAPNQSAQKLLLSWPSLFPFANSLFVSCFLSGARFCRGTGMFLVFLPFFSLRFAVLSLSSFLLLFSLSFSSCLFSPPFDDRSLQGPSPQMRGRLTRRVVDPAARCGTQAAHWP